MRFRAVPWKVFYNVNRIDR